MKREVCDFCGCDPYERVDVGVGMAAVAVTCCELGVAAYGRGPEEDEVSLTAGEVRDIAAKIAGLKWEVKRRDRAIGRLWKLRGACRDH